MSLEPKMPAQEPTVADDVAPNRNARSHDVDRELGAKLRAIRVSTGMTQAALGEAIGVSFQQLQKYETGKDRIAAGTLKKLAEVFGIHPGAFFGQTAAPQGGVAELREAMSMAVAVQKIANRSVRKRLYEIIEVLSQPQSFER